MLINILRHALGANKDGGPVWRTGSIFSCSKGLWDCLPTKPITTKHQSVFWVVSQSRRMSAIYVGTCQWISLVAASADPVSVTMLYSHVCSSCSFSSEISRINLELGKFMMPVKSDAGYVA